MVAVRETFADKSFSVVRTIILILCCLLVLYPIYYMFIVSISDGYAVLRGEVTILPKGFSLEAYSALLADDDVPRAYLNTVIYTVVGTLVAVIMTALCAYPLSRKSCYGRGVMAMFVIFTMFFDAGMVSNLMVVVNLHLKNTIWAIVLPGAINVWYMVIMRTFFETIPTELYESAYIDGANELTIFVRIVAPLSKSIFATMILFYAVGHWNSFMPALIYLDDSKLFPMQLILRNIVLGATVSGNTTVSADTATLGQNIKYAAIFVTVLPILVVYPFAQKYFVKGIMVGSVKG